ncbi:hypothetical protein EW146_g7927 [Bondarzewia mesenterica]|uniref:Uncharacterized protein n=1 Tax=Bondarzewia mesenterica TaxID=1095465 RepID=A0A4S4LIY2_9AGAM|nr:hypothetical protein EW146_g7927 [Bondarzewia mesenterica]
MTATAICTPNGTHAPIVSQGSITPTVLIQWRNRYRFFFSTKRIPDAEQADRVLCSFEDLRVIAWIDVNRATLTALSFDDLYAKIQECWLPSNWDLDLRNKITKACQGRNASFLSWQEEISLWNSALHSSKYWFSDAAICATLESGFNTELAHQYFLEPLDIDLPLHTWVDRVAKLDDHIQRTWGHSDSRSNSGQVDRSARKPSTSITSASPFDTSNARLPKLTEAEKTLLRDNNGCFKCRRFHTDHDSKSCTNGFPLGVTYKTLTQADVDTSKCAPDHAKPSVSRARVAAVLPMTEEWSGVIEGSDEDSYVPSVLPSISPPPLSPSLPPLSTPSLIWSCLVHGPAVDHLLPISALIDDGSQFVLIRESLVRELGLRTHRLRSSIPLGLAFSSDDEPSVPVSVASQSSPASSPPRLSPPVFASCCVKLRASSPDFLYTSRTVRALVAPDSLCLPIIFGGPFLKHNRMVVDHEFVSCVSKDSGYDLLHPPASAPVPVSNISLSVHDARTLVMNELSARLLSQRALINRRCEPVLQPDLMAAVSATLAALTHADQLIELDHRMREKFIDHFPADIPHTEDLPTDIYHRI